MQITHLEVIVIRTQFGNNAKLRTKCVSSELLRIDCYTLLQISTFVDAYVHCPLYKIIMKIHRTTTHNVFISALEIQMKYLMLISTRVMSLMPGGLNPKIIMNHNVYIEFVAKLLKSIKCAMGIRPSIRCTNE